MLKQQTVFVIGAGASKEFGLPVGSELAIKISEKLDVLFDDFGTKIVSGDKDLFNNVTKTHGQELSQYQKAAWLIRDGIVLAHSIDDFLDVHQHDEQVVNYGKAAIAKCVLEAERESRLFFDPHAHQPKPGPRTIDFTNCADTWLIGLMRLLVRGTPHADRAKIFDRCTFVIFNYDRCVEYFFVHALQRFYNIDEQEAVEIANKANFYHPYGLVGQLGNATTTGGMAPFGAAHADCYNLGKTMLKTYTESVESKEIRAAVIAANQIVFLGFAYHDQNMRLLAENKSLGEKQIIGTALGMSQSDISTIRFQMDDWENKDRGFVITRHIPANIDIQSSLTAADIFNYYSKSL
jgi:hypothetical protein